MFGLKNNVKKQSEIKCTHNGNVLLFNIIYDLTRKIILTCPKEKKS